MILIVNFQKNDPEQHFAKQIIITKVQYYLGLVGGSKKIFGQKISIPEMVWNGQKIGQITVKDQGSISLTLLGQFVLVFLVVQIWDEHSCTLVWFPADSATAIMRKLQDIKLSQQMDLPPSWFVWCQQNWLSRDTLCFVGNTLRPRILVDAEFVQISNASAISSRSLHIQKKLDLEFRKD